MFGVAGVRVVGGGIDDFVDNGVAGPSDEDFDSFCPIGPEKKI